MKLNKDFDLEWTPYYGHPATSKATHGEYSFAMSPSGFAVIITVIKNGEKLAQAVRGTEAEAKEYCRNVVIRGI